MFLLPLIVEVNDELRLRLQQALGPLEGIAADGYLRRGAEEYAELCN